MGRTSFGGRTWTLGLVLTLLALTGCSGGDAGTASDEPGGAETPGSDGGTEEPDAQEPEDGETYAVRVGTGVPGGLAQLVGATAAQVLNEHAGDRLRATPEAAPSQLTTMSGLEDNTMTFGAITSEIAQLALDGEAPFEETYSNFHHLMFLWDASVGFLARPDSGIESFEDLAGSGATIGASSPTALRPMALLLEEYGLAEGEDYSVEYLNYQDQLDAMRAGTLDVASVLMWQKSAVVEDYVAAESPNLLSIDVSVRESYSEQYPFLTPVSAPAGTYTGQDEDWYGYGVHLTYGISADVPNDVAALIARTIFENAESLVAVTEAAQTISAEDTRRAQEAGYFPAGLHPGVEEYLANS